VKALADAGFNLSAMFYTVGATSISSDEVLKAAEYKAREVCGGEKRKRFIASKAAN
jgi:hypothetical protein